MTIHKIYTLTSIGRPVDMKLPTNRAVVVLMAPAAAIAAVDAAWQGVASLVIAGFAMGGAAAAFGGWALGRELDPDDQSSAFVALAVAYLLYLLLDLRDAACALLVLFTTLGLVRQVNRTTGLLAKMTDSLLLLGLTLWVIYGTANPLFGLVAAASFALDGSLAKPLRRQWVFALLSFGAVIVYMVDHDVGLGLYTPPNSLAQWLAALFAVLFALNITMRRRVASVGDVSRRVLDPGRVQGGMAVALFAVLQGLPVVPDVALIAGVITGICLSKAFKRSFRSPA